MRKNPKKITVEDIDEAINNLDGFYKSKLEEGYHFQEIDRLTQYDIERWNRIYEEKETTIDQAFPWLF